MKRVLTAVLVLAAVTAAGIGGHWLGRQGSTHPNHGEPSPAAQPSGPVVYYRDPDGKPFYSAEPKTTAEGRPWRAVHAGEDISFDPAPQPAAQTAQEGAGKKILYYRNPMGLPDISTTPKKDSMGMDYIPVYEGEDDDGASVKLSPGRIQRSGVASKAVTRRIIAQPVRAPGSVQLDERRVAVISLRTEAFVEAVENVTTGSEVRRGQPLLRFYSPAIAAAAAEYVSALNGRVGPEGLRGSRQRLLNFAVPQSVLADLERTREVPLTIPWAAPRDGIVLERNVSEGMRVMPGDVLFRIADHSVAWVLVDVPEMHLAAVAEGQQVTVRVRSHPARTFPGKVGLVYPHLNAATRTVRVRIELPNPDFLLRPDMYAEAAIETGGSEPVLAVPESALIESGDRQIVIVDKGEGRFEPRPVTPGRRGSGEVEIRDGIAEGDRVVVSGNFLIDADSNLKAALKSLAAPEAPK